MELQVNEEELIKILREFRFLITEYKLNIEYLEINGIEPLIIYRKSSIAFYIYFVTDKRIEVLKTKFISFGKKTVIDHKKVGNFKVGLKEWEDFSEYIKKNYPDI